VLQTKIQSNAGEPLETERDALVVFSFYHCNSSSTKNGVRSLQLFFRSKHPDNLAARRVD